MKIGAAFLNSAYSRSLAGSSHCEPEFDASDNGFVFPAHWLDRRVVHAADSLQNLLDNAIYELLSFEQQSASTSAAIKSLIAIDLPSGLPSFTRGRGNRGSMPFPDDTHCPIDFKPLFVGNGRVMMT